MVVLIRGLASTALWTGEVDNLIKRPTHCTSQVHTRSCAVTMNLLMSHFLTCNTKPFPIIHKHLHLPFSYIHVPISLKYHFHITSSLISIHNLSWLASFKIMFHWKVPSERSLHGCQGDKLVCFKLFYFSCNMQVSIIFHYLFVLEAWSVSDQLTVWGIPWSVSDQLTVWGIPWSVSDQLTVWGS